MPGVPHKSRKFWKKSKFFQEDPFGIFSTKYTGKESLEMLVDQRELQLGDWETSGIHSHGEHQREAMDQDMDGPESRDDCIRFQLVRASQLNGRRVNPGSDGTHAQSTEVAREMSKSIKGTYNPIWRDDKNKRYKLTLIKDNFTSAAGG
eukprot:g36871.t1